MCKPIGNGLHGTMQCESLLSLSLPSNSDKHTDDTLLKLYHRPCTALLAHRYEAPQLLLYCPRPRCLTNRATLLLPPGRHALSADIGGVSPVDTLLSTSRNISLPLANKRGPTPTKLLSPCDPWSTPCSIVAESKNHYRPRTSTSLVHV